MRRTIIGIIGFSLPLPGCGAEDATPVECEDCPVFETVVELDFTDAPTGPRSTLGNPLPIARIPNNGGWLVAVSDELLMFDDQGAYLRTIGRPGEGPPPDHGEIRGLAFDATDSLLVADGGNQRIDVYAPDLTAVRSISLSTEPYHFDMLSDGRAVISGMTAEPPYDRYRARVVGRDASETLAAEMPLLTSRRDQAFAYSPLTAGDGFWIPRPFEYTVLRYDANGELADSATRAPSWFVPAAYDERYYELGIEENRPSISALMTDSAGRLWVQTTIPTTSDSLPDRETLQAGGRAAMLQVIRAVLDYAIEAIDVRTGALLASEILRDNPTHFIRDGYGYQPIEDAATGAIGIRIVRFDVER